MPFFSRIFSRTRPDPDSDPDPDPDPDPCPPPPPPVRYTPLPTTIQEAISNCANIYKTNELSKSQCVDDWEKQLLANEIFDDMLKTKGKSLNMLETEGKSLKTITRKELSQMVSNIKGRLEFAGGNRRKNKKTKRRKNKNRRTKRRR
jgi:hypothetical protein